MLHRSNEVFERCYANDLQSQLEEAAKTACWSDWLANYREGQTEERISYAERRRRSLENHDPALTLAVNPQATSGGDTAASEAATTTGTAVVDTPAENAAVEGAAAAAVSDGHPFTDIPVHVTAPVPPHLPPRGSNPACASICDPHFNACAQRCNRGDLDACYDACALEHRTCSAGCY